MYELAYHITPDIDEAAARTQSDDVAAFLATVGGTIATAREIKKIHLSYPIEHKHYAYFGVVEFDGPSEMVSKIDADLKLRDGILRFLIVRKDIEGKELRTLGDVKTRHTKTSVAPTHKGGGASEKAAAPTEEKQIEKELEGVLEKI